MLFESNGNKNPAYNRFYKTSTISSIASTLTYKQENMNNKEL